MRTTFSTRQLGTTDMNITRVGFGARAVGGGGWSFGWGPQDDNESIAAMNHALELGVNWIDTAAVYGLGHSEEVVGRLLKQRKVLNVVRELEKDGMDRAALERIFAPMGLNIGAISPEEIAISVAAEMIAVNSGLGFLIVDARNAGNRYDLVIAGMVLIGAIGVVLDLLMRRLERLDSVRWGYASE